MKIIDIGQDSYMSWFGLLSVSGDFGQPRSLFGFQVQNEGASDGAAFYIDVLWIRMPWWQFVLFAVAASVVF